MKLNRSIAIGLGVVPVGVCLWGFVIGPSRLGSTYETVSIPHLPPEWEGKNVAFISDFQVGMWWNHTGVIERAVSTLIHDHPAIVLLGGDFTEDPAEHPGQIEQAVRIVEPLARAGLQTFAVLGNHDYSMVEREDPVRAGPARRLAQQLEAAGIPVLQNEARPVVLKAGGEPLYVTGVGSHWAGKDDPVRSISGIPAGAARIVFMHNPDSFAALPPHSAPLAVCGHTHGGQIRIPFTPQWSWLTFEKEGEVHVDGWQPHYGSAGNRLYVNRGLGTSVVPVRINASPEITYFNLRRAGTTGS